MTERRCGLDWANERYIRFYTRKTSTWYAWPWQSRAVLAPLMAVLDRSGVLELGAGGTRGAAEMVQLPEDLVVAGIEGMLATGTLELHGSVLVMPKFYEAQEAPASDAARAKKSRETRRDLARAGALGLPVTKRDALMPAAPAGPTGSPTVTKRDAEAASKGSLAPPEASTVTKRDKPSRLPSVPSEPSFPATTTAEVPREPVTKRDEEEGVVVAEGQTATGRRLCIRDVSSKPGLDVGRLWRAFQEVHPAPVASPPEGWEGWCRAREEEYPEDTEWRLLEGFRERFLTDGDFGRKKWPVRIFMNPNVYRPRIPPPRSKEPAPPPVSKAQPLPEGLEPLTAEAWRRVVAKVAKSAFERTAAALPATASEKARSELAEEPIDWLSRVRMAGRLGDEVFLLVRSRFDRDFLEDHFGEDLAAALGGSVVWRVET
jgi:hypothetical protein